MDKLLFRDNDELHKGLQEALKKSIEFSTQKISDDVEKMYAKIIEDATIASEEQKNIN